MPPTKADLQADRDKYYEYLLITRNDRNQGRYGQSIDHALAAFPYIDGMMQFERKFERRGESDKDHTNIEIIDVVLEFAPYLFRYEALQATGQLLDQQRRIDRNTTDDLGTKLQNALELMWRLRKLWSELERVGTLDANTASHILTSETTLTPEGILAPWESLGVITRIDSSPRITLNTQLHSVWVGKCPRCGCGARGPKRKLLTAANCPKCRNAVVFTLISQAKGQG